MDIDFGPSAWPPRSYPSDDPAPDRLVVDDLSRENDYLRRLGESYRALAQAALAEVAALTTRLHRMHQVLARRLDLDETDV